MKELSKLSGNEAATISCIQYSPQRNLVVLLQSGEHFLSVTNEHWLLEKVVHKELNGYFAIDQYWKKYTVRT